MARAKREIVKEREPAPARIVYVQPPITLASVVRREGTGYRLRVGANESIAELEPGVDRALIDEAMAGGARVVLDPSTQTICGVLMTARTLSIDCEGDVRADVRSFSVNTRDGVILKTPSSFLQLDPHRVELFASETVVRAREAFRALARIIKLN